MLLCDLALVLLVAFGDSVLHSVLPLFVDANSGSFHKLSGWLYLGLQLLTSLALLGYVLFRNRGGFWRTRSAGAPRPERTDRLKSALHFVLVSVRQVRLEEWCLLFLVVFTQPIGVCVSGLEYKDDFSGALMYAFAAVGPLLDPITGLSTLAFVLYRRGGSFADIGLRWNARDASWALPLWGLTLMLSAIQWPSIHWLGRVLDGPGWHPPDVSRMIFSDGEVSFTHASGMFLNGFYEELMVRGLLMATVIRLTGRPWLAVVISVGAQISYHFYQGVPLGLSHILMFTTFAVFYAKTRLILPVALAHQLSNLHVTWDYALGRLMSP